MYSYLQFDRGIKLMEEIVSMNEWKELEIDNLPDIIKEPRSYQFEYNVSGDIWQGSSNWNDSGLLGGQIQKLINGERKYRYRKRQPKTPTHEEIITKWWLVQDEDGDEYWTKIIDYTPGVGYGAHFDANGDMLWEPKEYFAGKQSSNIPPEA